MCWEGGTTNKGNKKGKERMEGVRETEGGGVRRPQKSIGWEERAEIICAVRGQRGRANRGWGTQREALSESWRTKTVRDRTDNRLTVEEVRKMNQKLQKKERKTWIKRRKYRGRGLNMM